MTALRARGVAVAGRLARFDLTVAAGELVALIGPSGAGKSTALSTLTGALRPDAGEVWVGGRPIHALGPRERAAAVAWLPQRPAVERGHTAREVVAAGRYRFREPRARALERAEVPLARLGIGPLADRRMETLSGGEAQRVHLAALLAQQAAVLLVDEPGAHLDPGRKRELVGVLREIARDNTVVWVTHDIEWLPHLPAQARVVGLRSGEVTFDSAVTDPGLTAQVGALFGLHVRAVAAGDATRWVVQ